jgi:hypothetical protein
VLEGGMSRREREREREGGKPADRQTDRRSAVGTVSGRKERERETDSTAFEQRCAGELRIVLRFIFLTKV